MKRSLPNIMLHLEGLELLLLSLFIFHWFHGNWWMMLALILLPDIGMLGYLWNPKLGSILYDMTHTATVPAVLMVIFWLFHLHLEATVPFLAIWVAHIGADRILGYGLKYPTNFKDTHLQRV